MGNVIIIAVWAARAHCFSGACHRWRGSGQKAHSKVSSIHVETTFSLMACSIF